MDIKDRIKYFRKQIKNLTQDEFADKISISRSNIGNIESGRVNITERVITDICNAFNISESWLRTGEGEMYAETSDCFFDTFAQKYQLSPAEQEVARYCLSLTSDQRSEILKHILQVAEIIKTVSPEEKPSSIVDEFPPANISSNQNTTKVKPATRKISTEMKEAILNAELTDEKRVKMS